MCVEDNEDYASIHTKHICVCKFVYAMKTTSPSNYFLNYWGSVTGLPPKVYTYAYIHTCMYAHSNMHAFIFILCVHFFCIVYLQNSWFCLRRHNDNLHMQRHIENDVKENEEILNRLVFKYKLFIWRLFKSTGLNSLPN